MGHKSMGGCMIKCVPLERSVVGMSCVSKESSSAMRMLQCPVLRRPEEVEGRPEELGVNVSG